MHKTCTRILKYNLLKFLVQGAAHVNLRFILSSKYKELGKVAATAQYVSISIQVYTHFCRF